MWILLAFASALFAGLTSILAKLGIRKTDSHVATALRTVIVLIMAGVIVLLFPPEAEGRTISPRTWLFLILSGLATGASWLCYFKALQLGDVNKVVPVDKSSTILTIVLAVIFLSEPMSIWRAVFVLAIAAGTILMLEPKQDASGRARGPWLMYALLAAVFASLTAILGKIGIEGVDANLGTAIRTAVVLVMAWLTVFVTGKKDKVRQTPKNELGFIALSGLATGASWLCYYRALQTGPSSIVVPIDKLSIVVAVFFSRVWFKERLTRRAAVGLALIVAGTLLLLTDW